MSPTSIEASKLSLVAVLARELLHFKQNILIFDSLKSWIFSFNFWAPTLDDARSVLFDLWFLKEWPSSSESVW